MYICKNGNKILVDLPRWESGAKKGYINYNKMTGMTLSVEYNGVVYNNIHILNCVKYGNYKKFIIKYNNITFDNGICCEGFIHGHFGEVLGIINHEYKYSVGEKVNNIIILKQGDGKYKGRKKAYQIKCPKCGFDSGRHYKNGELIEEYWVTEDELKRGNSCPCCSSKIVVQGINDVCTTDYWMIKLGVDKEISKMHTKCSREKVLCKCPHCGVGFKKSYHQIYINKSIGCVCGKGSGSYPEKFMYSILKQLDVDFETQYSPSYFKRKEKSKTSRKFSDFHIPKNGLIIETDGGLGHKGGKTHHKSNKTLEELIEVDNWKDEQHNLHGLHTVRINCFESNMEYIKNNILNSELVDYFNFENIDWDKANEFAWFSNLKKDVCEYWNNKKEWESMRDIHKIFNISINTIINYLKKGTKLGWCNYNPKEEMRKSGKRSSDLLNKPVEIFKCGISLGIFKSAKDIEIKSEELFGVKLLICNINSVANGNRLHHKGYTFRYVDNATKVDKEKYHSQPQSA